VELSSGDTKRGKMLFLALVISLGFFLIKLFQKEQHTALEALLIALAGGGLAYVGTLWYSDFVVNKKVLIFIAPQTALFIFSEVLFLESFFLSKFVRIYEALLLLAILAIFLMSSYVAFLMANVFIVSSLRPIPLEQVAKTTSFMLTMLMIFFLTFSILGSGFHIIITIFLLLVSFFAVVALHLYHLRLSDQDFWSGVVICTFNIFAICMGFMLLGNRHELIAIGPLAVGFSSINIFLAGVENKIKWLSLIWHFAAVVLAIIANLLWGLR